jgi:NDP-sugar pyrophosphorylase family protein
MSSEPAGRPTIVFPMGGKGERMGPIDVPTKALVSLPKAGVTLLEYCIRTWAIDFSRVVLLVPPQYGEIEEAVGKLGLDCEVRYSPDPFEKCGRTKALAGALENGSIDRDSLFIVNNPDDVVINFPGDFAAQALARHRENAAGGCLATVVTTDSTVHTFTAFKIGGDRVTEIEHDPVCDKKAHIGITLFEPALAKQVVAAAAGDKTSDFEKDMFAELAAEGRLGYFLVPLPSWIAVNTKKDLALFEKRYGSS